MARDLEGLNSGGTSDVSHGNLFASGYHAGPDCINPLDDPDGPDFDCLDFPESQEDQGESPPFDLFQEDQEKDKEKLQPHQIAFREFVKRHRIDSAAFTSTSMFNYELIKSCGPILSTSPNVPPATDSHSSVTSPPSSNPISYQEPFAQTEMPINAQQARQERLKKISHLIAAHSENGDISEHALNSFLRKNPNIQLQ